MHYYDRRIISDIRDYQTHMERHKSAFSRLFIYLAKNTWKILKISTQEIPEVAHYQLSFILNVLRGVHTKVFLYHF